MSTSPQCSPLSLSPTKGSPSPVITKHPLPVSSQPDSFGQVPVSTMATTQSSKQDASAKEVQVPSSIPPPAPAATASILSKQADEANGNPQAQHEDEVENDGHQSGESEEADEEEDSSAALEPFDWDTFQDEYIKEVNKMGGDEDTVMNDFHKLATSFNLWAESAAQRDDERIIKRLRTRTRFVQIAEDSLARKRQHYVEVVDAFKKAMDLLRRP